MIAGSDRPAGLRQNEKVPPRHQYARIERERRFLLGRFPAGAEVAHVRRLRDRYIEGTTLRLREMLDDGCPARFKLTQKVPARASGAQQGMITTMYLSEAEFRVLSELPAKTLSKTRHSVPPFGIDVFEGTLEGLVLAEAEFDSAADADALAAPPFMLCEVSADDRFTGGQLARASRREITAVLLEYGVSLS